MTVLSVLVYLLAIFALESNLYQLRGESILNLSKFSLFSCTGLYHQLCRTITSQQFLSLLGFFANLTHDLLYCR